MHGKAMLIYRTQAYLGSTSMIVYHGRSFELASHAWHDAKWSAHRIIERRVDGEEWRVIVGGYNLG